MGLLTNLLLLPVVGPAQGLQFVLRHVAGEAERELHDPERLRGELLALELRHDMGEINEEEYAKAQEAVMARYSAIAEYEAAAGGER